MAPRGPSRRAAVAALCVLIGGWAGVSRAEKRGEGGRSVPFHVVLKRLKAELRRSDTRWPRSTASFAHDVGWRVAEAELVDALTRSLAADRPTDGYLKWQVLSFEPDLRSVGWERLRSVIEHMPAPLSQPEPDIDRRGGDGALAFSGSVKHIVSGAEAVVAPGVAAHKPIITALPSGTVMGNVPERLVRTAGRANQRLRRAKERVAAENRPIFRYREALIPRLPRRNGIRLEARIRDVRARVEAGDPSSRKAVDRLRRAVEQASDSGLLLRMSRARRRRLATGVQELGRLETPVAESVGTGGDSGIRVRQRIVNVPRRSVQLILGELTAPLQLPKAEEGDPAGDG